MPEQITVEQLSAMQNEDQPVRLLDVRQPQENEFAALPESTLIPLHELPTRFGEIDPEDETPLVVYCHHGMRSLQAAAFLEQQGLKNVFSLAGGIDAWSLSIDPSVPRYR